MSKTTDVDLRISQGLAKLAKELDLKITELAGQRVGFTLIVYNSEEGSRMNYVSNCERGQVQEALETLLFGWSVGTEDIPAHEVH